MPNFISKHSYIVSFIIVFLLLFFIGIFGMSVSWSESLFGAAALSAIGVGGIWWRREGFG
jgi:hypothetical protein